MRALTFGSAMVDIIAVLQSDSIEKISLSNAHQQYLLVEPGSKVEAQSITSHIGGGALNTAVCLSRLGVDVSPVVKTGTDPAREQVLVHCHRNGLDPVNIISSERGNTGSAVMIASHEKNAAIFTQRGTNTLLKSDDLEQVKFSADLVHAAPLSGNSAQMLPKIAEFASKTGAFFSSNPGIRQITTKANSVLAAAKHMALISINEVEAAALLPCLSALDADLDWGEPLSGDPVIKSQAGRVCLKKFCQAFAKHGPANILVTYGAEGAWLYDGKILHHQEIISAKVAGTAGASDSFVSTLAWGLKSGRSASEALLLAAHNASSVVSFVNTTDGLLALDELQRRL